MRLKFKAMNDSMRKGMKKIHEESKQVKKGILSQIDLAYIDKQMKDHVKGVMKAELNPLLEDMELIKAQIFSLNSEKIAQAQEVKPAAQ